MDKSYAFIYIGKLRTWRQAVPHWYDLFSRLKPDVYLFMNEQDNMPSEKEFIEVFGKDCNIKLVHFWNKEDIDIYNEIRKIRETREEVLNIEHSIQYYQLQKIFKMIDFSTYNVVVKFRIDAIPRKNQPFFIDGKWDDVESVVPHVAQFQKSHRKDDWYVNGFTYSHSNFGQSPTLGGAYVINKPEEYENIDKNKVVWMMNDHIYWSTGNNMIKLHQTIFDKHGTYDCGNRHDWTTEAQLIYHTKAVELQPLMVMSNDILR